MDSFTVSNGWLEKWKTAYGIRETRITGEADDVSIPTAKSWIEKVSKKLQAGGHMEHGQIGTIF